MKKIMLVILVFLTLGCGVWAEDNDSLRIIEDYAKIYGNEMEDGIESLDDVDFDSLVPSFNTGEIISGLARGENIFSIRDIANHGINLLAGEVRNTLKILVFVFAIGILSSWLSNMQNSFGKEGVSDTAFFVCYLVIAGISAAAFFEVIDCGRKAIDNLSLFMRTMAPVSLATLVAGGGVVSAASFEIIFMGVIEATEYILRQIFIPLIMMTVALSLVNNLSLNMNAEKLVQFMGKLIKWGIGIVMTLFVGIMGLQGIVSGSADGLSIKVTKFATTNIIPLVGGALSETVETVMNCSIIIKNAVGVAGIIIIILIIVVPIIKVTVSILMFRLCAALLQPVSDKRIVKSISDMADAMTTVFGIMMVVSVMFIIMITIIINVGNSAVMLGR